MFTNFLGCFGLDVLSFGCRRKTCSIELARAMKGESEESSHKFTAILTEQHDPFIDCDPKQTWLASFSRIPKLKNAHDKSSVRFEIKKQYRIHKSEIIRMIMFLLKNKWFISENQWNNYFRTSIRNS